MRGARQKGLVHAVHRAHTSFNSLGQQGSDMDSIRIGPLCHPQGNKLTQVPKDSRVSWRENSVPEFEPEPSVLR